MYDEVMQLIALAKNDEQYFKRIEELKQKQLELAHVLEIADTLKEADMHLANARQQATELVEVAKVEALEIKAKATQIVDENKVQLEKNKAKLQVLQEKERSLLARETGLKTLETEMNDSILKHRELTAARSLEQEEARKIRTEFETKMKKLREVAAS